MRTAIALDVGGSAIRAARVTADGISGNVVRREIGVDVTADELIGHLQQAVGSLRPYDEGDVGVGVGFPAFLDAHGRVAWSLNLPALNGLDLPAALRPVAGGRPVFPITDLAAAAIAEARLGSGRGVERFLCVSVGTGVNAAVVVDGQLLETALGCLGDAGHVSVDPEGPPCECGGRGCVEAIASGRALARAGRRDGFASAEDVVAAARAGDARGERLARRAGEALGRAIAAWSALLWPHRVAVAGGLSSAFDVLVGPARSELLRVGASYIVGEIEIVPAALGDRAGVVGAGLAALKFVERESK